MTVPGLDKIYPTLFIGLGGAGGHVLGRLNQLFTKHYGHLFESGSNASPLQFLLLDSDDFEKLDPAVKQGIGEPQKSFVSLSHFNPRRYVERQLAIKDSDLHRWFDRDALRYLEDIIIHDGASRLRMLGRLCLHRHYERVEQAIRQKLDAALDADVHSRATRIKPEPRPVRVFLISSSCGGTGSGTFLDVACMANRIIRDRGGAADVQGFVYLPFPFIEANAQIDPALEGFYRDNAWAFFEELNYFLANPAMIPEFALDPGRRYGEPPRAADQFGMDLFRTVYLIGNHVPTFGTLDLGNQLHSYVAHGIFHTFLTPEEGSIQSHYSNIKAKLKDRARNGGGIKRFATFGYAEYRRHDGRHEEHLVRDAVRRDWEAMIGAQPKDDVAAREARSLLGEVDAVLESAAREAAAWAPNLPSSANIIGDGHNTKKIRTLVGDLARIADEECDQEIASRLEQIKGRLRATLGAALDERIADPACGLKRETAVLTALEHLVQERGNQLATTQVGARLSTDDAIADNIAAMIREIPEPRRQFRWFGPMKADHQAITRLAGKLATCSTTLKSRAADRLESAVEAAAGEALLSELRPSIHDRVQRLRSAVEILEEAASKAATDGHEDAGSPTMQTIPPDHHYRNGSFQRSASHFCSQHDAATRRKRREAWESLRPELERGKVDAAPRLQERLSAIWRDQVQVEHGDKGIEEWIDVWAQQEAQQPGNAPADLDTIRRNLLARLVPLSAPACPIDRSLLDKADTVPEIVAVVGPFKNEKDASAKLSIQGECSLIEEVKDHRIAVLQTWYAFPSQAVEGMGTLRRSYLNRDRVNSLPHTQREWNKSGLTERVDASSRFTLEEYRHIARVLALSKFFTRPDANGDAAPGLRITGDQQPYLLRYTSIDGLWHLEARGWHPVDGYQDTWHIAPEPTRFVVANLNGGEHDLYRDFSLYLGSELRQHHSNLLQSLDRYERSREKDRYRRAYLDYIEHLKGTVQEESNLRRVRNLPLLERLAAALHAHVRQLDEQGQPPIAW